MCSPFAAESLSDPGGLVVLTTSDDASPDTGVRDRLSSLPCIVVAVDRSAGEAPELADVAPEDGVASVEHIVQAVERNPVAALQFRQRVRPRQPAAAALRTISSG